MIASRRNGARRTEIEAAAAADDVRARMGAKIGRECDVARFVEAADEIARAQDRLEHGGGVARTGSPVAVAQNRGWGPPRPAPSVEPDVRARPDHGPCPS